MAQRGDRLDVERKLTLIADRILRGQRARNHDAVRWYMWNRNVGGVAAAFSGAGISHPFLSALFSTTPEGFFGDLGKQFSSNSLWVFIPAVLLGGVIIVLRALYTSGAYEKRAIESLALFESCTRIEVEFINALEGNEPMDALDPVHESILGVERTNSLNMPARQPLEADIKRYADELITKYCAYWNGHPPMSQQAPKAA